MKDLDLHFNAFFFDLKSTKLPSIEEEILKVTNLQNSIVSSFTGTKVPLAGIYLWPLDKYEDKELMTKNLAKIKADFIKAIKKHNATAISPMEVVTFVKPEAFSVGISLVFYVNNAPRLIV
jgi:hypothetical protein